MISHSEYCSNICKAKCCYTAEKKPCPNLTANFKCGIYDKWQDDWCNFQTENIITRPIRYIIAKGLLPKHIEKQCCYAHPELLENLNG